jgi:hypothetical protein
MRTRCRFVHPSVTSARTTSVASREKRGKRPGREENGSAEAVGREIADGQEAHAGDTCRAYVWVTLVGLRRNRRGGFSTVAMERATFYEKLRAAVSASGDERHRLLSDLHNDVLLQYLETVRAINEQRSTQVCGDGRTLGQIVGHIAEWERFTIQSLGQIITGVRWPGIMKLTGYVDFDGSVMDFASVSEFNVHQAAKHASWPWRRIREMALRSAQDLRALLACESLLSSERLDATDPYEYELRDGSRLRVPAGWYLWLVSLEHSAVEHARDFAGAARG